MRLDLLKNIIQSSHINFLFGSGLSNPYLSTLGKIETWLTEAEQLEYGDVKNIIKTSLEAYYFSTVMKPCLYSEISLLNKDRKKHYGSVINNYKTFLSRWNEIMAKRNVSLLDKQVNIFTTNIDNLVETAAEEVKVEFNDGFKGRITPIFSEDTFSNITSKVSPLYQNQSMIPVFNYMKIHGSINWKAINGNDISIDTELKLLQEIADLYKCLTSSDIIFDFGDCTNIEDIKKKAEYIIKYEHYESDRSNQFCNLFSKLVMVRPRKNKFSETVLELHFYELMRLYSNALECSNSLLIVAGFSFADEHIAKITVRAANSNPTLQILVFAFDDFAKDYIKTNINKAGAINNNNILYITPQSFRYSQDADFANKDLKDLTNFDLESINRFVFGYLGI